MIQPWNQRRKVHDMRCGVLFVCMGNICRSPTAEAVLRRQAEQARVASRLRIDSAGTHDYHAGKPPDARAQAAGLARGYDLAPLRARQVTRVDFDRFDYVLAMDNDNLERLRAVAPLDFGGHLGLLLDFAADAGSREVPDPYYGGPGGFAHVLDLIEAAARGLLEEITRRHFR